MAGVKALQLILGIRLSVLAVETNRSAEFGIDECDLGVGEVVQDRVEFAGCPESEVDGTTE